LTRQKRDIQALERRLDHLEGRFKPHLPSAGFSRMLAEMRALRSALSLMGVERVNPFPGAGLDHQIPTP